MNLILVTPNKKRVSRYIADFLCQNHNATAKYNCDHRRPLFDTRYAIRRYTRDDQPSVDQYSDSWSHFWATHVDTGNYVSCIVVRCAFANTSRTSTLVVSNPATALIATETTATSAVRVTTTNANGQTVTTIPATVTSDVVTTSNGVVYTVTQIVHNPTGALDSGSSGGGGTTTGFFANKGAVAGVFVVVGLVVVGMIFALGLLCFRRRRRQRLDREVTAAAIAASSSTAHRSPIDEGDDVHSSGPTTESYPSTGSGPMAQYNNYGASYGNAGGYDPYAAAAGTYGSAAYGGSGQAQAGYEGLQQGDQGYYYDPRQAEQGAYSDEQGHPGQRYDDPYGGYSGEGSLDTPVHERENPLHVS